MVSNQNFVSQAIVLKDGSIILGVHVPRIHSGGSDGKTFLFSLFNYTVDSELMAYLLGFEESAIFFLDCTNRF